MSEMHCYSTPCEAMPWAWVAVGIYEKGFDDGMKDRFCHAIKPYKDGNRWHCGQCSIAIGRYWRFCQFCGQKIGWDEVNDENVETQD